MLVKLLPDQASRYWGDIKGAVEVSLPPVVGMQPDRMSNILTAILTGGITVWISVEKAEGNVITGIVLTKFLYDDASGTKSLLLYCVYGYGVGKMESWKSGLETLKTFATSEGCHRIIGYTDVPSIIKCAEMLGMETRYRFLSYDLNAVLI